jgi:hypothetical protein
MRIIKSVLGSELFWRLTRRIAADKAARALADHRPKVADLDDMTDQEAQTLIVYEKTMRAVHNVLAPTRGEKLEFWASYQDQITLRRRRL